MSIIVTLDPGHVVGWNTGINKNYREGTAMFHLAYKLKYQLERYGFKVYVTRTNLKDNPSLTQRGNFAIAKNSKVFISLHSNAAQSTAMGAVAYRSLKRPESSELGNRLLDAVQTIITAGVPKSKSRGLLTRKDNSGNDYYTVINSSVRGNSPVKYSYIIEHGFHTNPNECAWLMKDANLNKLAIAEAKVLAEYFGLDKINKPNKPNKEEEEMFNKELEKKVDELQSQVKDLKKALEQNVEKVYPTLDDVPPWYYDAVEKAVQHGILLGTGDGKLNVDADLARILTVMDRMGLLDKKTPIEELADAMDAEEAATPAE